MVWGFWEFLWCQRSRSAPPLKFLQDLGLHKKSDGDQEEAKMPWFTLHSWESHFQISSVSVARGTLFLPLPQVSLELTAYRGSCWLQDGFSGQEHPNSASPVVTATGLPVQMGLWVPLFFLAFLTAILAVLGGRRQQEQVGTFVGFLVPSYQCITHLPP